LSVIIIVFSFVYLILSEKVNNKLALLISLSFAFLTYLLLRKNLLKILLNLFFALIVFFLFYTIYSFYYVSKQYSKEKVEIKEDFYKSKLLRFALIFAFLWFFINSLDLVDLISYKLLQSLIIFLSLAIIALAFYYFIIK